MKEVDFSEATSLETNAEQAFQKCHCLYPFKCPSNVKIVGTECGNLKKRKCCQQYGQSYCVMQFQMRLEPLLLSSHLCSLNSNTMKLLSVLVSVLNSRDTFVRFCCVRTMTYRYTIFIATHRICQWQKNGSMADLRNNDKVGFGQSLLSACHMMYG